MRAGGVRQCYRHRTSILETYFVHYLVTTRTSLLYRFTEIIAQAMPVPCLRLAAAGRNKAACCRFVIRQCLQVVQPALDILAGGETAADDITDGNQGVHLRDRPGVVTRNLLTPGKTPRYQPRPMMRQFTSSQAKSSTDRSPGTGHICLFGASSKKKGGAWPPCPMGVAGHKAS